MSFWISFCGELEEGYKPDFSISFEKPEYRNGYTSINVCHQERVDHLKATIEVLNTDSLQNLAAYIENHQDYIKSIRAENARLREALELIAMPVRSDETYNRSREACEQLAREALEKDLQK
jgi:hypothetical protein